MARALWLPLALLAVVGPCAARNATQSRKTQFGVLPNTKLTAIQNRGIRKKDTPPQLTSTRILGALQVTTEQGTVKGYVPQYSVAPKNDWYGVRAWIGVPYAAPPIGNLRFAPPQPPAPYAGIYEAITEKPLCPQQNAGFGGFTGNEDCLYMNIWAPRTKPDPALYPNGYPVLFFVHGGAYVSNSNADDGTPFAKKDTVVVNISFRMGVFGALVSPDGTTFNGNQHILDQIQGLQWVKNNIHNFDGNPNDVTLSGHSTGASDLLVLMSSPAAKGLYQAAYPSSPFAIQTYDNMTDARALGTAFYDAVGCGGAPNATDCMLTKSTQAILTVEYNPFYNAVYKGPGASRPNHRIFGPVVQPGGNILPFQPYVAFARGEISDVPFFFWNVQAESYRETFTTYTTPMDEATYRSVVATTWGEANAAKIFSLYPFPNDKRYPSSTDYRYPLADANTDYWRICPTMEYVRRAQTAPNIRTMRYQTYGALLTFVPTFNWATAVENGGCKQAICHADDMPLLWLDTVAMIYLADTLVGHALNSAVNNFVHTKDPNRGFWADQLMTKYPLYSQQRKLRASLDYPKSTTLKDYRRKQCEFWDAYTNWPVV